ncbi:MAG: AcrR family transcriptional regulator [Gammaproteobacteria bacterium]|jgi:AcrR family transcriptional regulator
MMNSKLKVADITTLVPSTAVYSKGKKRVQEILEVATEVLAFEGYSAFTMRNIASKSGMTHRNLQYYFKTKSSLFQAVVERMIDLELKSAHAALDQPKLSPEEKFSVFIDCSIRDNEVPLIRGFHFELWAMATRDDFAAECRDKTTIVYCDFISTLIEPLTPGLNDYDRHSKAAIILSMLQGLPLIRSAYRSKKLKVKKIEEKIKQEAIAILSSSRP